MPLGRPQEQRSLSDLGPTVGVTTLATEQPGRPTVIS
jgi:hypothetical protein